MSHNHTNYNPLHPPFPSATTHKDHNNQDYMPHGCSIRGNELVVTATHLLITIDHQKSFLSQSHDSLVFWARYPQQGNELYPQYSKGVLSVGVLAHLAVIITELLRLSQSYYLKYRQTF